MRPPSSISGRSFCVTVKDAGAKAIALQLDAGNAASFDAFVESVNDALANLAATRFDFLVNNAGNSHRNMPFATATEEELDSIYNVHFKGVFFLATTASASVPCV
jgi:NAD(P)-dependent dehydrogenase (short-subunit alcohol dehydrogenase family)